MNDPPRLLECAGGELERELLASALRDVAPAGAYRRVQAVIGAGIAFSAAAEASAGATMATAKTGAAMPALVLKWFAVGALAGTIAVGTAAVISAPSRSSAESRPRAPVEPRRVDVKEPARSGTASILPPPFEPARSSPSSGESTAGVTPATRGVAPAVRDKRASLDHVAAREPFFGRERGVPRQGSESPPSPAEPSLGTALPAVAPPAMKTLAEEVALVDSARGSLARRDPTTALASIARHEVDFPGGALALDVAVLRVRALFMAGRRPEAEREARRLLAANPTGPYAARIREFMEGTNP